MRSRKSPLFFVLATSLALGLHAGAAPDGVLEGGGVNGDWKTCTPGVKHRITVRDLPPPFATRSSSNGAKITARPAGAMPQVPPGFEITEYATGLDNPRHLTTAPNGDIFVSESGPGEIHVLRDTNGDGKPDLNAVFASGLKQPFGLAFYPPGPDPKYVYVADTDGVVRFPYANADTKARGSAEPVTSLSAGGHLTGGGHWTRDITFSKDGKMLFVSIGSLSNTDENNDPIEQARARIFVMNPDGSEKRTFASGIRNPVGIAIQPETGELWTSVNERDGLGDDLVPDYITSVRDGGFYGWPYYYIGAHPDPRHVKNPHPELAAKVIVPDVLVHAHSASLNMVFYEGTQFPAEYQGDAFAAFHGSWNRATRTGYKVVRVPLDHGRSNGVYEDFVTGFITPDGQVWGRPVGLTVARDGALLMSEDAHNTIWRIAAKK
ncbi:MAG: sorbosone dehydrogenase family protein [Terrimicrobiaceae bacterium]|nr:sorbosone dehydrogenase family protein [Terrimicrobiaceae bacterium]